MTAQTTKKYYVGRYSAGFTLIGAGAAYLASLFNLITLHDIIKFWPVILMLIGVELLIGAFISKGEKINYDWLSLLLMFIMFFFSLGMAIAQFCVEYFI